MNPDAGMPAGVLGRKYYSRSTVRVARSLLGQILVRESRGKIMSGRIVETEAYTGRRDGASHAFRGPTPRSSIMFGPPGVAYVYLCYGFHFLLNITTEAEGVPGAVLIRAFEPLAGQEAMKLNRGNRSRDLADGPGKLTKALGIDISFNGHDLTLGKGLYLIRGSRGSQEKIVAGPRIGITRGVELPWRFRLLRPKRDATPARAGE